MSEPTDRTESLFAAAVALEPAQRAAFLDEACAGDPALRARVEALLHAHDRPAADPVRTVADPPPSERPGAVIAGRYRLLEELGAGGMGTVWVAEQTEPVRRKVAVKLIKPGMDSRQVIARFEQERQALALMDHPNIAKVLDGGLTETGRPFFVMELVKGVPITQYCDDARLGVAERLALFVTVCSAVQHAHQKGIIHRDLKPSNILVALYDGVAVPKVIDFGLAKAVHQPLTERALHTAHEEVLGTPLYMSPEQARLNNLDIDTRADVYSLGVLLYELLTGTTPLEKKRFRQAAWDEVRRLIREEEPPRPSTRLSSTDALPSLAACRGTEPAALTKLLRGELDWIAMKALEKDRGRRYETANGFAQDVQRYLAGEPVLAVPPSAGYRLRKFARKHRAALTMAAVIAVLLVAGIVGTTVGLFRARAAEKDAQRRLTQIENGTEIISAIFANLDLRRVKEGAEPLEVVLAEQMVQAGEQLEGEAVGDRVVVARLQNRLGRSLLSLGRPQEAIALLLKARENWSATLGADAPETLVSMGHLAQGYQAAGKLDLALPLFEETLKLEKALLGTDHRDTLATMNNLASAYQDAARFDLALPLYEETLRRLKARLGADHPDTLSTMNNLASAYQAAGKPDRALPLFEESLELLKARLGADHPHTLATMNNLASAYKSVGKLDRALPLYAETFKLQKARLGADHPYTLVTLNNLATGYKDAGEPDRALPLHEEALRLLRARLGVDHPETLKAMNNLAACHHAAGKPDRALPLHEETFRLLRGKLGADHPDTLRGMSNLATGYKSAGKLDLALPLYEETVGLMKARWGTDHPDTLAVMSNLAAAYHAAGKLDRALPLFEETLRLKKARLGADHPDTLATMNNLGSVHRDAGKPELALPLLREAAAGMESRRFQHSHAGTIVTNLVNCHEQLRQFAEAEVWRRKWLAVVKGRAGADSVAYAGELAALGLNLLQQQKAADAEPLLREALALREQKQPDAWTTFNTKSVLGGALLIQKKYADAEPLLLAGFRGMKQRADMIPREAKERLREALARLVRLYEATGKQDEAGKWRKELESISGPGS